MYAGTGDSTGTYVSQRPVAHELHRVDCLGFTESFHRYMRADSIREMHSIHTNEIDRVLILMYAASYQNLNTQVAGAEGIDADFNRHFRMYLGPVWRVESRGPPARV